MHNTNLVIFLAFLCTIVQVSSQACNSISSTNITGCYALRTSCNFNLDGPTGPYCASGPPSSCQAFLSDSVGCTASSFKCYMSGGLCAEGVLPNCTSLSTSQLLCSERSDCRWNTTQCITFNSTCRTITNPSLVTCGAYGCFYDPYLTGTCYNSLSEVQQSYSCSYWSTFGLNSGACLFHGCSLSTNGLTCGPYIPYQGNPNITYSSTLNAMFVNPRVIINTFIFTVDVYIPNILNNYPCSATSIGAGLTGPGYSTSTFMTPGVCNDLASNFNISQPPSLFVSVPDPVGMQIYFNNWVQTNHTLTFSPLNTTFSPILTQIIGPILVKNNTLDSYVLLDSTTNWVIHRLSYDLNALTTACNQFGVNELITGNQNFYTVPISVLQRDYLNDFTSLSNIFYIQISSSGSISTVTSSSSYNPVLLRSEVSSIQNSCPSGQTRLQLVYLIQIQNVYAPGVFAGPRNLTDIVFTSPSVGNTLQNCYGLVATSLVHQGCSNSMCQTQVTMQTRCRVPSIDGNTFNNCSYSNSADTITDLGSVMPYPLFMNEDYSFWVNDWTCPTTANQANGWANCSLSNQAVNNNPDFYQSSLIVSIYPGVPIAVNFDVFAGLLPTPSSPLSTVDQLSQGPTSIAITPDLLNDALTYNGIFTFVVGILSPTLQLVANLTLAPNTLFSIQALDINGVLIPSAPTLHIGQVFQYMSYVPETLVSLCRGTGCSTVPACANVSWADGFSIPVITLRALLPANGYSVSVAYILSLPSSSTATLAGYTPDIKLMHNGNERKILSTTDSPTTTAPTTSSSSNTITLGTYTFLFLINDALNPNPPITDANYTKTVNGTTLIQGFQVQMQLFVDTGAVSNPSNTAQLVNYTLSVLPQVVADTLNINVNQVIDCSVSITPPVTGLSTRFKKKEQMKRTRFHARSRSVSGVVLYASFVIVAAPNVTSSSQSAAALAATFISSSTLPTIVQNLALQNLTLDTSVSILRTLVFVEQTELVFTTSAPTTPSPTTAVPTTALPTTPPPEFPSWEYWHNHRDQAGGAIAAVVIFWTLIILLIVWLCVADDSCYNTRTITRTYTGLNRPTVTTITEKIGADNWY